MGYSNTSNIKQIRDFFRAKSYPDNFIAGLLANWQTESANSFDPKTVQRSYLATKKPQYKIYDNATYVNAVDKGTWRDPNGNDFTADKIGFGLAQWTSNGRKKGLLEYAKSKGKSVGDLITQCEWTDKEIHSTGYANCRKAIYENWDIEKATRIICTEFERPASMQTSAKEGALRTRVNYAVAIYKEFFTEPTEEEKEVTNSMNKKIMLDAGHDHQRNVSPVFSSYNESTFAWKLQTYLKTALEKYGFEVGTTRQSQDEVKDVVPRGKCAKGYDLFISLHSNACSTESVDRPVGIFLAPDTTTDIDEISQKVAVLLTDCVRTTMGTKQAGKTYYKVDGTDRNKNGILTDDDYYGVLFGSHTVGTPGIILEHSFHTNKAAAEWLYQDSNIQLLATNEAKVIDDYFGASVVVSDTTKVSSTADYIVQKGDTLSGIASKFNSDVDMIMALNPRIRTANMICVGWKLTIPTNVKTSTDQTEYIVQSGDTLSKIAKKYNTTVLKLVKLNGIVNASKIYKGQIIKLK